MARIAILFLSVLLFALNCNKGSTNSGTITVVSPRNDALFLTTLQNFHAKFYQSEQNLTIDLNENAVKGLREYCRILRIGMDIVSANIANASTTRTVNGDPYVRRILSLNNSSQGYAAVDEVAPFRLVYDPTHPDSLKAGQNRGYVKYPNVNVVTEMTTMIDYSRKFEEIKRLLQQIDPKTIIF